MKYLLTIIFITNALIAQAQFEVLPVYQFVEIDSVNIGENGLLAKSIVLQKDTLIIRRDTTTYIFSSAYLADSSFHFPVYKADYNEKFYFEISSFKIVDINEEYVDLSFSYTKRHKKRGFLKGKYYNIEDYRLDRNAITGFYLGKVDEQQRNRVGIINLALFAIIIGVVIAVQ